MFNAWHLTHANALLILAEHTRLVNIFKLKTFFSGADYTYFDEHFGIRLVAKTELSQRIEAAFQDYILAALSELGDQRENKSKIYIEARYHLDKAQALLKAMPHPAGKMSQKLSNMSETLQKMIEGSDSFSASRATRFMEMNLVRKLRDLWIQGTGSTFQPGGDDGKNPKDFILYCFKKAGEAYPEITWFNDVDERVADILIKGVRK